MVAISADSAGMRKATDRQKKWEVEVLFLMTHAPGSIEMGKTAEGLEAFRAVRLCNLADHLYNSEIALPPDEERLLQDLLDVAQKHADAAEYGIRVKALNYKGDKRAYIRLETVTPVQCDASCDEARKQIDAVLAVEKAIDDRFRTRVTSKPRE